MLLLRANTLAQGHSGVRPEVVEALLALLDHDLLPVVPSRGSVGASGDLAPLAHLALPLIGRGQRARGRRRSMPAAEAPRRARPRAAGARGQGRAGADQRHAGDDRAARPRGARDAAAGARSPTSSARSRPTRCAAPTPPSTRGCTRCAPTPGSGRARRNLWRLLQGSAIRESHRAGRRARAGSLQLRCMPQVHGAARDLLADVERKVAVEMNAVTDNPLVFPDTGEVTLGRQLPRRADGAWPPTCWRSPLAELGAITERRIEKLTNHAFSGLPPFLVARRRAQLRLHDRAGDRRGAGQREQGALPPGERRLASPPRPTRRTTSRWAWARRSSCSRWSPTRGASSPSSCWPRRRASTCCGRSSSSAPLERLHAAVRARVPAWDQDREMAPDLAAAETFLTEARGCTHHGAGVATRPCGCKELVDHAGGSAGVDEATACGARACSRC